MRLIYVILVYLVFNSNCQAAWVPGSYVDHMEMGSDSYQRVYVGGVLSGVGVSFEKIKCGYVTALDQNMPLTTSEENKECSFNIYLVSYGSGGQSQILSDWTNMQPSKFKHKELYENKVRTVGEFLSYAYSKGGLTDTLIMQYRSAGSSGMIPGNEHRYCFGFQIGQTDTTGYTIQDPTCTYLVAQDTTCDIQQNISFDHGYISASELSNGNTSKTLTLSYTCPVASKIRFLLPGSEKSVELKSQSGDGYIQSALSLDGKSLHGTSGKGVLFDLKQGKNQLSLTSTLSGNGLGAFKGLTVLMTTYE